MKSGLWLTKRFLKILKFEKSYNLIGRECFGKHKPKNFAKYGVGLQRKIKIIRTSI